MKTTIIGRLIIIALILLSFWLGYNSFEYGQKISVASDTSIDLSNINNLLVNSNTKSLHEMEVLAAEQDNTLEFMVWPEERLKILNQSIELSQQQINLQPSRSRYWQRLLNLQYERDPDPESLAWILDKIYVLSGWNTEMMISLSRYCIPFAFSDNEGLAEVKQLAAPETCYKIIDNLPLKDNQSRLAHYIGITIEDLDILLNRFQVRK